MANRLAVIHFQPLELYPPAMNDLRYFEKALAGWDVEVYTTTTSKSLFRFGLSSENIRIRRLTSLAGGGLKLYLQYGVFYLSTLVWLLIKRPQSVLYFETISAFPALIYKRLFNRKARILVHYHEYTSPQEYKQGMLLNRWFHRMEQAGYNGFLWISHMIQDRLELFLQDNPSVNRNRCFLLPNFPPAVWENKHTFNGHSSPVKVVLIGSLSLETMYVREFASWVVRSNGEIVWDTYAYNFDASALRYLQQLKCPYINFKNGIPYYEIPSILKNYHVGVILYKGTVPNYVYNAPNKLFEYLSANLDVWFPQVMIGSRPYVRTGQYPKVIALDFTKLESEKASELADRSGLSYKPSDFFAETVLSRLVQQLKAS